MVFSKKLMNLIHPKNILQRYLSSEYGNVSMASKELSCLLQDRFTISKSVCKHHGRDESYHVEATPDAVVFPSSTEEVSKIVKIAAHYKIPIIPFGAGTSLEGHISPIYGGISIDMSNMNKILNINEQDMACTVQAGITREALNEYLRATGLFFPVDPGANASLGGMIGTNASGTTTIKYGNMKSNVMGLTVVMADGSIIKTGSKSRKSSAGYDLTRLMIGSEGTLGLVTEIHTRLHGIPASTKTGVLSFRDIKSAVDTCVSIMQMGISVARMELLDMAGIKATNEYSKMKNPESPSLLIDLHGSIVEIEEQISIIESILDHDMINQMEWSTSLQHQKSLWKARHCAWYATMAQKPGARGLSTDVCVPISQLTDVILNTQKDLKASKIYGTIVGHIGDGNFHVLIPFNEKDDEEKKNVKLFSDRLVKRALNVGGTCTGEHGIGIGKIKYLQMEHESSYAIMQSIKKCLDPQLILNPGKIIDI